MSKFYYIFFVIVILISGCSQSTPIPPTSILLPPTKSPILPTDTFLPPTETNRPNLIADSDLLYAESNDFPTKLDIYAPLGSGPWPIVIIVHGLGQTKTDYSVLANDIAEEGAVVYNINVNLSPPYETSIHRIACATRYVRATAKNYNGDSEWLILLGNSGGALTGIIAALAGEDFGDRCVLDEGSAIIDAFVGYEGVYEFITTVPPESMKFLDFTHLEEEDPELWRAMNPYTHIGRNPSLKIRLVHGDFIESSMMSEVPLEWSSNLQKTLTDAGYDAKLVIVEGADHDDIVEPGSHAHEQVLDQVKEFILIYQDK